MLQVKIDNPLKQILRFGQSIWYDGLVSKLEFERMIHEDGIRGATTNPTIFEKALSSGNYDEEISRLGKTHSDEAIYKVLSAQTVQEVADQFLPLYEETKGDDGFVSIEVSPLLASDTEGTIREARELYRLVNRKNIMIKVPATREGLPAIEVLISEGISVNVTLIFSVQRYQEVMNAAVLGLEKRLAEKKPLTGIASVASFFVSRVDTMVDKILEEKGADPRFFGKAAIANCKMATQAFETFFSSARFQKLKAKGAAIQRPLWASTGTKNPEYSDVLYVESLIGPYTVNTIPPATLAAYRDHGRPAARLKEGTAEAAGFLEELRRLGVDLSTVTQELEDQGVRLFSDSYKKIIQAISLKKK